jgi:hypothetical protein
MVSFADGADGGSGPLLSLCPATDGIADVENVGGGVCNTSMVCLQLSVISTSQEPYREKLRKIRSRKHFKNKVTYSVFSSM